MNFRRNSFGQKCGTFHQKDGLERDAIIVTKTAEQDSVQVKKKDWNDLNDFLALKNQNLPRHENNKDKKEPKCD